MLSLDLTKDSSAGSPALNDGRTPVPLQGADLTREKLLAATHELLVERNGGQASVSEICARAGVNVAMVKYCFGNKDGLLQALIDHVIAGFAQALERLDALDLDPAEKLRRHIAAIVHGYVRYPYLNRLVNAQLHVAEEEVVQRLSRNYAKPMRAWHQRVLREGARRSEFRRIDPTLFFFTVIGMAEFFFTAQPLLRHAFEVGKPDAAMIERFINHTVEMLLHGIVRMPETR